MELVEGGTPVTEIGFGRTTVPKIPIVVVVIATILVSTDLINHYIGAPIAGLLAVAVMVKESGHFASNVLKGELRVGESAVLKIVNKIVWIGTGLILVSQGYGVHGLIYGVLTEFLTKSLLGRYKISTSIGTLSIEHARSIWDYAKSTIVLLLIYIYITGQTF